ncbi:HNH endonuclease signature motif containing protein [uncultured Cohaesibacter sp.]|uniref:HNH endonuclease n=1 Tax=uncultured Cohaesibacter sp. TaxID=1002546 RepID=UPI00292E3FEA|nr:HNH endonuclease signature motif containing protein [uncultured Cohaesibacter sp.]
MARRSRAAENQQTQVIEIKQLLDTFLERVKKDDLREQVRSLVPAVHALRDLGSGLVKGEDVRSARDRMLAYLLKYPKTLIDGDELMVVSGIGEWARRVRELRVQYGWTIYTGATLTEVVEDAPEIVDELEAMLRMKDFHLRPDQYVLMNVNQDREAALRWNQLNAIRKKPGGVKAKLLEYLRLNVGHVVTGEELRYLAKDNKEWARRTRELRTEDGWPVVTRMQGRSDLSVGAYLLEEDRQAEVHDRNIPDPVRVKALKRDKFCCTYCGWSRNNLNPDDPRKFLELHHLVDHVKGGANELDNLKTLCNVHHDQVHAGGLVWNGDEWYEI